MSSRPECPKCGEYATLSGCNGGAGEVCKYAQIKTRKSDKDKPSKTTP
ncbi:MAG: hypothetical protein GY861_20455 [bacterium]|nr:hypothetical protein [bacterium]